MIILGSMDGNERFLLEYIERHILFHDPFSPLIKKPVVKFIIIFSQGIAFHLPITNLFFGTLEMPQ
jgi:hypothetical protein